MASTALANRLDESMSVQLPGNERLMARWVDAKRLKVDPRYQRALDQHQVDRLARIWDLRAAESLLVSAREDGDLIVIDGQQRLAAARQRREPMLHAMVCLGLSLEEEADLFVLTNNIRKGVHVIDRFRAAVVAQHKAAREIQTIMERHQFRVDFKGPRVIPGVQGLEIAHIWHSLDFVLDVIDQAWEDKAAARSRTMVLALASFDLVYRDLFDETLFIDAVHEVSPKALIDDAVRGLVSPTTYYGRGVWAAVAALLRQEYHKHCRKLQVQDVRLPKFEQPNLPMASLSISKAPGGPVNRAA